MPLLEQGFADFLGSLNEPLKGEFLLSVFIGRMLREGKISVRVLKTADRWFGVTYQKDRQTGMDEIRALIYRGEYPSNLYGDL